MSDLRIALVAEGVTDQVIIEAALRAILPRPFVLTLLQPEATRPELGGGWCGVLKWCREFAARGWGRLEDDPSLELFDLIVLHVDADVAEKSYTDCGGAVSTPSAAWQALSSHHDCPPIPPSVDVIRAAIGSWLGCSLPGGDAVLCIPSKSSEAWLAAALFPERDEWVVDLECSLTMEARLSGLPKALRVRKNRREYLGHQRRVTACWGMVRELCTQADAFHHAVLAAVSTAPDP